MPSDLSQKEYIIYMNKVEIFKKLYLLFWFNFADTLGDDNQVRSTTHSVYEVTAIGSGCISLWPSTTLSETGICCKCPDVLIIYKLRQKKCAWQEQ